MDVGGRDWRPRHSRASRGPVCCEAWYCTGAQLWPQTRLYISHGAALPQESQACSNQTWISATTTCSSLPRLIAEKSIHRSTSSRPPGHQESRRALSTPQALSGPRSTAVTVSFVRSTPTPVASVNSWISISRSRQRTLSRPGRRSSCHHCSPSPSTASRVSIPAGVGLIPVASKRAAPLPFRVRQCSLVSGGAQTTAYSCELTPEEHKCDTRYTGASLPEDWIEQLRRNLDGVR
jgi:hypothetical protein